MEKTYKRVPFDIELANKIQSGEVEGNVVIETVTRTVLYPKYMMPEVRDNYFIELPEETPKQCCGDVCGDNRFEIIETAKKHILDETNIESRPEEMAVLDNILFRCWQMGWLKCYEQEVSKKETSKHEFKPFDKVLVRDSNTEPWAARLYDDRKCQWHFCQDGHGWNEAIPFAGNEHLVGTTDNPE